MATKALMTAEDLLAMPDDGQRYELIRGELVPMGGSGGDHSRIGLRLGSRMLVFVEQHHLGEVLGADGAYRLEHDPDTVRVPDASFLRRERWDSLERTEAFIEGAPDLAVEVVSPSDSYGDVRDKALMWLAAGARLVWVLQPIGRAVTVYPVAGAPVTLGEDDILDGGDVLPGFSLPVRAIFA